MVTRARFVSVVLAAVLLSACQAPTVPATLASTSHAAAPVSCRVVGGKAERRCTPGATNPQVTQSNIGSTVCRKGWTDTIRPSTSYTNPLKVKLMTRYGIKAPMSAVELDHLIPLSAGGDPRSEDNLYPELWDGPDGAHAKDGDERALQRAICNGRVKLVDAQRQIVARWTWA